MADENIEEDTKRGVSRPKRMYRKKLGEECLSRKRSRGRRYQRRASAKDAAEEDTKRGMPQSKTLKRKTLPEECPS